MLIRLLYKWRKHLLGFRQAAAVARRRQMCERLKVIVLKKPHTRHAHTQRHTHTHTDSKMAL